MVIDKKSGDLMIPLDSYPHIPYWFTLRQAMAELENSQLEIDGLKSLPRFVLVFDEKYNLMGMVRRRDILGGLQPDMSATGSKDFQRKFINIEVDPNLMEMSPDFLFKNIRKRAEQPVSKVMIPISHTVDYEDHIMKVIHEMVTYDLSMIPVLCIGEVVGVIRSVDVFHEMARYVL
jgi:CBS-domain-containing membrane protein